MKLAINLNSKRVVSLIVAFAMFVGTLFVANVGVSLQASADDSANLKISYWDGSFDTGSNGFNVTEKTILNETGATGTSADDPIIIDNAKELATLVARSNYKSTAGYYFKLSDAYDVYILQPENVVNASELMALSSGAETKAYFEDATRKSKLLDWGQCCNNGTFGGSFDGNGVEIYGLYVAPPAEGKYARENVGLFGSIDPGVLGATQTGSGGAKTYNDQGNFFKNVIVKNSYYYGSRRMGGIAANSNGPNYGCSSNGIVYFDSCVVANSYMYCTGDHNGSFQNGADNNGVIAAYPDGSDTYFIQNCLVYGNETYNAKTQAQFDIMGNVNTYTNESGISTTGKVTNCIAIGTRPLIYTRATTPGYAENNYELFDVETLRGAAAMAWADGLAWGTDWFAIEGEYPTPIKPANYLPTSAKPDSKYSAGNGTKENPYIIRSVDQLSQMVKEQSYTESYDESATDYTNASAPTTKSITSYRSKYYKVADGVDELYINNVKTQQEANELFASGKYNKWTTADVFAGNFDGNGVTIYGLMNSAGFVSKIDGTFAAIKNVHFKAAHIESGSYAAVVTTNFGTYGYGYKASADAASTTWFNRVTDPKTGESVNSYLISNVSVTESYIKSTLTGSNSNATAGGIVALTTTPPFITIKNCFFDGVSSALIDGTAGAGANANSTKAGIASMASGGSTNRWIISDCVSINEYPVSMKSGTDYNRFTANSGGGTCEISNFYGPINSAVSLDTYAKFGAITSLAVKSVYDYTDLPTLDWAGTWKLVKANNDRTIPMPIGIASDKNVSYAELVANYKSGTGAYDGHGVTGLRGQYGWEHELTGSGTEEDPYLITNALQLAQAIGSGGKSATKTYYYKLACDIDLTGSTWINQTSIGSSYVYVPFEGVLDGAGHAVTGLSASDSTAAGLIPVLNGGTVKNLHIRNAFAISPTGIAGAIAGKVNDGYVENCSVENVTVIGATNVITGSACDVTNSYYVVDGKQTFSSDVDKNNLTLYPAAGAQWYKGTDGIYRHVSFAKANSVTDVDGDGIVDEIYGASDIVALRNHLLGRAGYENIFGDVSHNGVVNISDLAILRRRMSDDFSGITDGFWRNVELGNVAIYYAENDTYDMARQIELYFEALNPKTDIVKYAGTAVTDTSVGAKANYSNQANAVVITQGTPTADTYDDYSITFDSAKNVLTIYGGSFTAVEQAVKEFIQNADPTDSASIYTTNGTKSILALQDMTKDANSSSKHYLGSKTVEDMDGKVHTVYYAWGDEFEGSGSFDTDKWGIRNYRNEGSLSNVKPTDADAGDTRYLNLEGATVESIKDLWEVNNGKLVIWRGVSEPVPDSGASFDLSIYSSATQNAYDDGDYDWGYKAVYHNPGERNSFGREIDSNDIFIDPGLIQTSNTMMFKQGYSEMRAALPNDGHAFPAWWFMTGVGQKSMSNFENFYLFDKVYKINSKWDGVTMNTDPTDLTTYKYEMPQAFLEYDIVEFMQAQSGASGSGNSRVGVSTGDYRDFIQLTIHKYYNQHVKEGKLYVPDWSTGGYVSGFNGITQSSFNTTSGSGDGSTFIHRFDPNRTTSAHPYTVVEDYWLWQDETQTAASYSIAQAIKNSKLSSGAKVNDIYTYGFWWSVDEAAGTYDLIVYVDFNNDGNMAKSEMVFHVNETNGHEYNDPTWGNKPSSSSTKGKDAAVWNQYAYMLIDNAFYTSNPEGKGRSSSEVGVTMFTDLLTKDKTDETTTFELEYVRVYQEDGRRDLVTADTESFNTGNRYGY